MNRSLKIAVADDELDMRDYFQQILPCFGHHVVAVAKHRPRAGRAVPPSSVPTSSSPTSRCPTWTASTPPAQIYRDGPIPVILVSAYHDPDFIERAEADHILAYLVKPIKQADLEPAIAIAMRRFEQFQALRKEAADLKQALEDRKVIEKAKGILMKKAGLDEHDAFRRLQKLASDKNRKLIEIAHDPDRRGSLSACRARPGQGPPRPTAPDRLRRPPALPPALPSPATSTHGGGERPARRWPGHGFAGCRGSYVTWDPAASPPLVTIPGPDSENAATISPRTDRLNPPQATRLQPQWLGGFLP